MKRMKSKVISCVLASLIVSSFLTSELRAQTIPINSGDTAPYDGILMSDDDFNHSTLQMLDLKACEKRLEKMECADSLENETQKFYTIFGVGVVSMIVGFVIGANSL